jgi:signal transduction histidine kinase
MYIRARRQLVASLRDRAEQAEAAQQLLARQATQAERARIAGEMHDVLGHRVSLMALQAGRLQVRPDLPLNATNRVQVAIMMRDAGLT